MFHVSRFMTKKLLLHTCCAPCLTHPLAKLEKDYELTVFFYGPNIHPREEYEIRFKEARKYLARSPISRNGVIKMIEGEYDPERWFELTKGHERDPERGERCRICYEMRLAKTAETAVKEGFQAFATTLSISPHKDAQLLNEIGEQLAKKFGVRYLPADWKKRDGFKKSLNLSKKFNLHRQNYCGCVYSNPKSEVPRSGTKSAEA
ncbi:MAG: epoxyqueuosine reductase QueH [Patescibacteria group bacterium]